MPWGRENRPGKEFFLTMGLQIGQGISTATSVIFLSSPALACLEPLFTIELRLRCVGIQFEGVLRSLKTRNKIGR